VDFLADPADAVGLETLLRWIDREARAADSDKVRTLATHEAFRRVLKRSGYMNVASEVEMAAKINAVDVGSRFYEDTDSWHVTLGDSDLDG
jgi:hypothetical protein